MICLPCFAASSIISTCLSTIAFLVLSSELSAGSSLAACIRPHLTTRGMIFSFVLQAVLLIDQRKKRYSAGRRLPRVFLQLHHHFLDLAGELERRLIALGYRCRRIAAHRQPFTQAKRDRHQTRDLAFA